jgi:hypothetical protein
VDNQGIQRDIVEHDRDKDLTLARGELGVHGPAQRGKQIPPFRLVRGVHAEPGRQPVPVLGVQWHDGMPPEMPPDLGRHLEDDELVRPGGEPALPPELPQLAGDGYQCIGRRLVSQVIKLWPGDPQPRAAPGGLTLRDTYQQLVQAGQGSFPPPAGPGQRPDPLR